MDEKELKNRELSEEELKDINGGMNTRTTGFGTVFGSAFAPFFKSIAEFFFGGNKKNL